MARSLPRTAWLLIAAAASWTQRGASARTIPSDGLAFWQRGASSSNCFAGFSECANANLPSNFCCPPSSVCDVLAGNSTVLCCPEGSTCSSIDPIPCDLSLQDADAHPDAPIKTTALNGVLVKCGSGTCCPFGYSCSTSNACIVNVNQNAAPLQNVPTSTATVAPTTTTATPAAAKTTSTSTRSTHSTARTTTSATGVTVVEATSSASATSSPTSAAAGKTGAGTNESPATGSAGRSASGGTPTASIVGGVVGGLAGLLLIGAAMWFLCGRRFRRRRSTSSTVRSAEKIPNTNRLSRSTSSFANIINNPLSISSPKPQGDVTAYRTDFIRKLPSSGKQSRPVTPTSSVGGLLVGSASSTVGTVGYGYQNASPSSPSPPPLALQRNRGSSSVVPIRGMRSSLPRRTQRQPREPSMEEINVGADPSIISGLGGGYAGSPAVATAALASATGTTAGSRGISNTSLHLTPIGSQGRDRSNDRMTTFSGLMLAANLDPERPFVPGSLESSPASRRR